MKLTASSSDMLFKSLHIRLNTQWINEGILLQERKLNILNA